MKTLLTILVISFSLILNSCSNKDDSSESLGYAPETLIGKSLNLSLGPNSIAWALSFFSNGVISMIPCDHKTVHSVSCYDTCYNGSKCCCRSGDLYAAAA